MTAKFSNQDLLTLSRRMIHLFLQKQSDEFMKYVSDDFVWIGDYDLFYHKGANNFIRDLENELHLPPLQITYEEYSLLAHERTLWVTYGRCNAITCLPDYTLAAIKFHFTLTWKLMGDELKLIHAMGCHIPDAKRPPKAIDSRIFGSNAALRSALKKNKITSTKLMLTDTSGNIHYLYPSEIRYIQANGVYSIIHTRNISFTCHRPLHSFETSELYPVHKSFLVNKFYVIRLRRFMLTLTDGTEIPISRTRYTDFKTQLEI